MAEWDGFLPAHDCRRCGQPLHGQGTGYPAELYAGTYTGLCYPCTGAAPYIVRQEPSGATVWSHPPHCPSWRRDRREFYQFPGCPCRCGATWRSGAYDSYPVQCVRCSALLRWREALADFRREQWLRAADYLDWLDGQVRKDRKRRAVRLTDADASEFYLHAPEAVERRRVLRAVWAGKPETWDIPAEW